MNEVWRARSGIVARWCARGRVRPGGRTWPRVRGSGWKRCRTALTAGADLPAGLPDRDRGLRLHRRRERPAHRDRAVDQAGQPGGPGPPARPWDPVAGQYRAPDEKTIRVVLDRLDPRALTRALLGPRRQRPGGPSPASVRDYRARRAAQEAKALARGRLRAVAVDGKTSRGARRADGTRVHLLGVAEHGGRLLDHLEIDVKHNETSSLHRTPRTPGPGRRRGDLRRPPHGAGEPELAGRREESPLHSRRETEPAAAICPGQGPALAAGTGGQLHPRHRARPSSRPAH